MGGVLIWLNGRGARRIFEGLKFQFLVSLRSCFSFALSLKPIMVSFRVPKVVLGEHFLPDNNRSIRNSCGLYYFHCGSIVSTEDRLFVIEWVIVCE